MTQTRIFKIPRKLLRKCVWGKKEVFETSCLNCKFKDFIGINEGNLGRIVRKQKEGTVHLMLMLLFKLSIRNHYFKKRHSIYSFKYAVERSEITTVTTFYSKIFNSTYLQNDPTANPAKALVDSHRSHK